MGCVHPQQQLNLLCHNTHTAYSLLTDIHISPGEMLPHVAHPFCDSIVCLFKNTHVSRVPNTSVLSRYMICKYFLPMVMFSLIQSIIFFFLNPIRMLCLRILYQTVALRDFPPKSFMVLYITFKSCSTVSEFLYKEWGPSGSIFDVRMSNCPQLFLLKSNSVLHWIAFTSSFSKIHRLCLCGLFQANLLCSIDLYTYLSASITWSWLRWFFLNVKKNDSKLQFFLTYHPVTVWQHCIFNCALHFSHVS